MIGLYYLVLVPAVWIGLTWLLWKLWRGHWKKAGGKWNFPTVAIALLALSWLAVSFWYSGGRKFYYDAEVKRLCAIDGGVKVYETITLPPDRFDSYGNIGVRLKGYAKPTDEYYYSDIKDDYIKTGSPSIRRRTSQLIRRGDGKVLGESIHYERGGGDLPLPGQPSSFSCPAILDLNLETSIFRKET